VRAVTGSVTKLVNEAKRIVGDRNVYVDGGTVIRSALDRGAGRPHRDHRADDRRAPPSRCLAARHVAVRSN
jgi:hypothetical protein